MEYDNIIMLKYSILNNYDMGIGKSSLGILFGILLVSILAQDYVEVDAATSGARSVGNP